MQASGDAELRLSASDLSQFLSCHHRTALELAVAKGQRVAPAWVDPFAAVLRERGLQHERSYVDQLRAQGLSVLDLTDHQGDDSAAHALKALRMGVEVVLQPTLTSGYWLGRPDVLRRVDAPSDLGSWSYQVIDTKLARETKGGSILQLALYSELLAGLQGAPPELFHVITPNPVGPVQTFRVQDFAAYFRLVRHRLEDLVRNEPETIAKAHYPEPVEHCNVCRWWQVCTVRRRQDDHLSLVAGLSRMHGRELQAQHISTLAELAQVPLPLPFGPRRGAVETYVRLRDQARVQFQQRTEGRLVHELLPLHEGQGLTRLPAPSMGDIFLDIEGDPFAGEAGREYLFGLATIGPEAPTSQQFWAHTHAEERAAFEHVVDEILCSWRENPAMHVYHYSHYEPTALKRLMSRHMSREDAVDRMLRAELFVDLYAITKHTLRASVESYSIKNLEPFYGFERAVPLPKAGSGIRAVERALELGIPDGISEQVRSIVEGYNRDDCLSALRLRTWLERLRATLEEQGTPVVRPAAPDSTPPERMDEHAQRVSALVNALIAGVPLERTERTEEQEARWLLAHLLDWHRRESKAPWWEFFRLRDLSADELFDEKAAISGLQHTGRIGGTARSPIDRYCYPQQDTDVRDGDNLHLPDGAPFGTVDAIDRTARTIDVKKRGAQVEVHPAAVFAHSVVPSEVLAESLLRLGADVVTHGVTGGTTLKAARDLLLQRSPRLRDACFEAFAGENVVDFARRVAPLLDSTVLAIQGPPGAGKTYTGARMICELVKRGMRVGVTAVSHKVIRKLIDDAIAAGDEQGVDIRCAHKVSSKSDEPTRVAEVTDNGAALDLIKEGRADVVGGTQWLWARPEASAILDVLFVDEAGQISLANALAASQAARSVVLLGDPQQLEQPQQGTHPEGADRSALEHLLKGHKTVPSDHGIFLGETWRLAPSICAFTSEVFYEGRLRSHAGLEQQALVGAGALNGSGLWVMKVDHDGNQNSAAEEVAAVEEIVVHLLTTGAGWTDSRGVTYGLTSADILVVAPYNAQVSLLGERLANHGVKVGTVDRFQGQQAPVVIYSLATSTPEDAPRGMEFLYSLNRLNVATSRARCACIVVANPRLFEPECHSPRQMQLANALCRFVELARPLLLGR